MTGRAPYPDPCRADVLIFAIEAGRFGPARLPQNLEAVGVRVATLCPADNVLARTDHASRHFALPPTRSGPRMARALAGAIAEARPRLIVPADEQAVVLLQGFARGDCARVLGEAARLLIAGSLGPLDRLEAMLYKSATLALARETGVRVPEGQTVASAAEAQRAAADLGYPVYVKHSFGWAGQGVVLCEGPDAVAAAVGEAAQPAGMKALVRRLLGRDWYPAQSPVDVQKAVAGRPAMYCALAWQGQMVGGFAGEALRTISATGPSCEVRIGPDAAMAEASARMIAALGCTGWIGFDFMVPDDGGAPVLLECNPRPIQVCHLGYRIGVDLSAALARLLAGEAPPAQPLAPTRSLDLVLFPYALDGAELREGVLGDIPATDPGLMAYGEGLMAQRMLAA